MWIPSGLSGQEYFILIEGKKLFSIKVFDQGVESAVLLSTQDRMTHPQ